jgi:flagellar hook-associated protein 1 FlgK
VSNLSQLVGVTTTTDSDGSMNVFIGNGQPLVLTGGQLTATLTTVPDQFNASQLEVATRPPTATRSAARSPPAISAACWRRAPR